MPAHASFIKKCMALSSQVAKDLQCTTKHLEFSEVFMQRLLSTTKPEAILRQILNAEEYDMAAHEACYHAMHVKESAQALTSIAIATGNARALYNQYISGVDTHTYANLRAEDFDHSDTLIALKTLRGAEGSQKKTFVSPRYAFFAGYALEIEIEHSISLDDALSGMSILELHGCAPELFKKGVELFSQDRMAAYSHYPYYYLNECTEKELEPTFSLLCRLHGGIAAQNLLSDALVNSPLNAVFLKADEIATLLGESKVLTAIKQIVASKDDMYARPLAWAMKAVRQEGRLSELDALTKNESRYLLDQGMIQLTDLSGLPKLAAMHSERRFAADLGL
ncbi:hypothetical protein IFT48_00190 [Pseudomonas fluorescens]|uniref:hypothetical protein n=1 Tax=Pseudomonas TaxID=286 RepID=UPI000F020F5C|nr:MULTISPECIES: hypothetical protein [Pseudomonas]MBD8088411.1 hypothetical protein [Pseudomonas fluorescens]MBD8615143.1 hypothetical protein [Pseudomonas putida]MBD8681182.1 hypothetical protein [Pseudomonas sp. CFBP 13719]